MTSLVSIDSFDLLSILFDLSCLVLAGSFIYGIIRAILSPFLPGIKGRAGERKVRRILDSLPHEYYQAFNDVHIPTDNNTVAQIDHVVVTTNSIICIETKNYSGEIVGKSWEKYWDVYYGNRSVDFYNPLFQNRVHVKALCSLLSRLHPELPLNENNVISLVVFTGKAFLNVEGDTSNIIFTKELYRYITKSRPKVYADGFYEHRKNFIGFLRYYAKDIGKHVAVIPK